MNRPPADDSRSGPVIAVDDVEANGKTIDDETDEALVLCHLSGLGRNLDREVGRECHRSEKGRQQIGDHAENLARFYGRLGRVSRTPINASSCSSGT